MARMPKRLTPRYGSLRAYLTGEGRKQTDLAKDIGISVSQLNRILHRRSNPSITVAVRLARRCNVPLESMLSD